MANIIQLLIKAQDMASSELKKVQTASEKLAGEMAPLGRGLGVAGLALGAAGVASIKMAGDFEQSLNIFKSVSGATADQMEQVAAKARELGRDASLPGVSAKDAALAMGELAKAGLSVNETLAASKGVLSLAKAGQMEVSDAATIAAQALNAFKLQGKDAAVVADVLASGANASAADMHGLALGLQQSAAVAGQFGVSLQDTVTTLGIFANRGLQGSDAGTSLKTMLISLSNPSKDAADTMKELGLRAYDAKGQFVGMRQFALNLQTSLKGLTQEQQNTALATIFGTDAFRAAAFLADSAGKSYDDMSKSVNRVGAAQDLAKAQNSGFNGALDNLRSTLETLGTDLGTKVLPPLTKFLQTLAASGVFDFVAKNIDLIVIALGTMGAIFVAMKIGAFISGIVVASKELMELTKTTTIFNAVMVANPIMVIVVAIIALIGILIALQVRYKIVTKAMDAVRDAGVAAWKWIKDAAATTADWIVARWQEVRDFFVRAWQGAVDVFNTVKGAVIDFAQGALKLLRDTIADVSKWIEAHEVGLRNWAIVIGTILAPKMVQLGIQATVAAAKTIAAWASAAASMIASMVSAAISATVQAAKTAAAWVAQAARVAFAWVTQTLPQLILAFVRTAASAVVSAATIGATFVLQAVLTAARWAVTFAMFAAGMAVMVAQFLVQAARMAVGWLLAMGPIGAIIAVVAGVIALIIANWDTVKQWLASFWQWVMDNWANLLRWLLGPLGWLIVAIIQNWDNIKNAFSAAWDWIKSVWNAAPGFFKGLWDGIVNIFRNVGSAIGDAISGTIKNIINGVLFLAEREINGFINLLNGALGIINKLPGVKLPKVNNVSLPRLASGTPSFSGGLTMVGERGPEVVGLPQGSRVMSATQTREALRGSNNGPMVNIENLNVKSDIDVGVVARQIAWQLSVRGV